ncbi:hypothetical protein RSAG8_11249, partial [Rhizoctonia solani AG-8 WAC10335]
RRSTMGYQDKRTKLPQSLLEEISSKDRELASGHVRRAGGKGKGLDRRAARKEKRVAVKRSKVEYFSKGKGKEKIGEKRVGGEVDPRPAKRPKVEEAKASVIPAPKTSKPNTTLELSKPKPVPNSNPNPAKSPSNPKSGKLSKSTPLSRLLSTPAKKRTKDAEDDEIAWLEAKLGITKKKKKGYGGVFSADGLDDILVDLDRIEKDMGGLGSEEEGLEDDLEEVEDELEGGDASEASGEGGEDRGLDEGYQEEDPQSDGDESGSEDEGESDEVPALLEPPEENEPTTAPPAAQPKGAYVPPHLRQKADSGTTQTPEQVKLARQIKGLLNRLSEQNIEGIVGEVEALYRSNPRNDVTQALTNIILDSVSSSANLLDTFVILHAAFVAAIHEMLLEELRTASSLLQVAIDRYYNACISIKHSSAGHPSQLEDPMGFTLANELPRLAEYEAKLRDSKLAIAQSVNHCSDVSPMSRMPVDTLVHVFQLLVDMEHGLPLSLSRKIPKYPLILSHVCNAWRRVISHSPYLWSRIKLSPGPETIELLKSYVHFHSSQAREASMDISISDNLAKGAPEMPNLPGLMLYFTGRIRSLALQLNLHNDPRSVDAVTSKAQCALIAECLRASKNALKRFALNMVTKQPRRLFIESASTDPTGDSLRIDLPHDELEGALSSIVNLWLRGTYFNWESKAYHGLIALRLDAIRSASISELQLMNLLASSPRLRWLDIGLNITRAPNTPELSQVCLPDLEYLVGEALLLQLIRPGSNELTLSIIGVSDYNSDILYDAAVKDFFSSAHIAKFYSDGFLSNISDISSLLSLAPRLRDLAISHISLPSTVHDIVTYNSLDTLYLLEGCRIHRSLLQDLVDQWAIKRLVFWGANYILWDTQDYIDGQPTLEEDLSDLRAQNIQLEFVPDADGGASPMDLFGYQDEYPQSDGDESGSEDEGESDEERTYNPFRVVLHCCGNERTYNPFYTLVAHHLCQKSHSHRITLQYCLWDFLRSLGETQVGGEAISREESVNSDDVSNSTISNYAKAYAWWLARCQKSHSHRITLQYCLWDFLRSLGETQVSGEAISREESVNSDDVSNSTISNYAKAYAWWLARGSVSLTILKPVEFLTLQPRTMQFFNTLFTQMIISSQSNSPLVDIRSAESAIPQTRSKEEIEEIAAKARRLPAMCKGIGYFIQTILSEEDLKAGRNRGDRRKS